MEKVTQNYRVIEPAVNQHEPAQTFVHSFAAQNGEPNSADNLYFIFTIWAPRSDVGQIAKQTTQVFTERYFTASERVSREVRFKQALNAVNTGIRELNAYYKHIDQRFHIEAAIVAIFKNNFLLTTSGDTHIYRKAQHKYSSLTNTKHHPSFQNLFEAMLAGKAESEDKLLITSARFSDRLPRSLLYEYLQSSGDEAFKEFHTKVGSLHNHQLGIIEVSFEPIALTNTTLPDKKQSDTKPATALSGTLTSLKNAGKRILRGVAAFLRKIMKGNLVTSFKRGFKRFWNSLFSKYINPNPIIPLAIIGTIFIIILSVIGYFIWYNPHNQALKKTYTSIEQSLQKAQGQATKNQKSDALQTLADTKKLIANLPAQDQQTLSTIESQAKKPTLTDIEKTIAALQDQLQNITRVTAETIYTNPQSGSIYSAIAQLGDNLYAISQTSGEITFTAKTGAGAKPLSTSADLKNTLSLGASTATNSLFALTPDNIFQIKPDGAVTKQVSSSGWPSAVSLASYLQNIYLLSPTDNQIYRYAKTSSGFGARNAYLKKPATGLLSDSTSLSVNGNVFVAKRNGEVLLFDQGNQKDFAITGKPTDLQDVSQIWYTEVPDQLILLNPIKKAFIIINLSATGGEFLKEYIVNSTSEVSSFTYDSKDKNVYFTTDNTIQKFTLQ